jgi:alginate O-acetyltransferase complex protein AlgI
MLFCSEQFFLFFVFVFVIYWALPSLRLRVWLLLGASFYFYASGNRWLALLIFVTSTMDWAVGHGLERLREERGRRLLLAFSLVVNLGLLFYFKYANFFLESLEAGLRSAGATASLPVLRVILPVGISFYTFEAINYTVDVYRRRVRAERNLAHFLLFITFFPHLVAGPIVRARDFLPQIRRPKRWSWLRLQLGAEYFLLGLFKKLVIADHLASMADPVFAAPQAYRSTAIWLATVAYTLQIFCDFSGYSDMAIGAAHMLGYKLAQNFNMPYLASNISEFWRRWHISLSNWLRDYLFIPLGGSRHGRWQTYRNLLLTMTLGGLWHGANWTFMIWGLLHGAVLIGHRRFQEFSAVRPRLQGWLQSRAGAAVCVALTFLTVMFLWIFFRAQTPVDAFTVLHRLVIPHDGLRRPVTEFYLWLLVSLFVVGHGAGRARVWRKVVLRLPAPIVGVGYALGVTLCLLLAPGVSKTFIYFQF